MCTKIENRLKRKYSLNNDKIIVNSPFANSNNNSPLKDPKIGKLKKYATFMNNYLNETKKSKITGEKCIIQINLI